LNVLFQTGLALDRLQSMGARLGSDVPFFLTGGFALGTGRGEKIRLLPQGPPLSVVLVKPAAGLSTAKVFQSGKAVLTSGGKAAAFAKTWQNGDLGEIGKNLFNGLEPAALVLMPEVGEIRERLTDSGAEGVLLSGSGPTVFGLASSPEAAKETARRVQRPGWDVWVTRTISGGIKIINK
jgi:4-diphosphocytidyl-2-C-methyl-D-erythritol kinase